MKKLLALVMAVAMTLSFASVAFAEYPDRDFNGTIMWGAGGVCDITSRAITAYAEKAMGKTVVMTNRPGGGGAVSTAYVNEQPADGYELLFGAENPQIAKIMGTSELDYDDFTPITIFCTSVAVCVVNKDSKYDTFEQLIEDMKGGDLLQGATGQGGLPYTVAALVKSINGCEGNQIVYDGEGPACNALMGGEVDYVFTTLGSAMKFIQSGDLKCLTVFAKETVPGLEEVRLVTDIYPAYNDVLPWGPFYGVFVKNGTDAAQVEYLTKIFAEAASNEEFQQLLLGYGCVPACMTGEAARAYLDSYKATTSYLIYDAGGAVNNPADLGIVRP
ncbi:MAG: tripartite tricarboxylate transporter substrate binding protein [Clostridia bacterium]|nr:tripartite tricarboxylate transporter substrate binding protein [Clostridia bacterium]